MKRRLSLYICILLSLVLVTCQSKKKESPRFSVAGDFPEQAGPEYIDRAQIRNYILEAIRNSSGHTFLSGRMADYYRDGNSFLWLGSFRVEPQADSLLACLAKSAEHGLNPERFHASNIRYDLDKLNQLDFKKGENINRLLARLEYNLTLAYLQYAGGLNFGFVNPRRVLNNLEMEEGKDGKPLEALPGKKIPRKELFSIPLQSCDSSFVGKALEAAARRKVVSFLRECRPTDKWYVRIQAELGKLETFPGNAFPEIPLIGDTLLKPGDSNKIIPLVAKRLGMTGELASADGRDWKGKVLTKGLLEAVNLFRRKNGMAEEGSLGSPTLEALSRPVAYYKDRLRINLERLRWKPKLEKGERYVVVNVASSLLKAVDSRADTALEMRVCVGSKKNKTPLLSSTIRYMEMNPYWNVPQSIIMKEIIPSYRKDTAYFTKHRFKIYDKEGRAVSPHRIDWSKYREGVPFDVKQDNKEGNSLGRMIFRFPNTHSVYLHDTPARYGFRLRNRAISHGCVRLEKALDFAGFLMGKEDGKATDRIRLSIGLQPLSDWGRKFRQSAGYKDLGFYFFQPPVPLFIEYYTVSVSENGEVDYGDDPYRYDAPLLEALDGRENTLIRHTWIHPTKKN